MTKLFLTVLACAPLSTPMIASGQAAPVAPAAAPAPVYSTTDSEFGTLWDNPAAKAIIIKYLPELGTADAAAGLEQARAMTLRTLQQFKPDVFTDEKLGKIDADLAKLPVK